MVQLQLNSTLPVTIVHKVTGLSDSHPRLIAALGKFARTVWLPLLSACNFLRQFFFSLDVARYVLGSLKC